MLLRVFLIAAMALFALPAYSTHGPGSVVRVNDGCTGFYLGDGLVATAGHCISKLGGQKVAFNDTVMTGTIAILANARVGFDDIAIIKINSIPHESVTLACEGYPKIGDEVHMTGYPGTYGLATVWGRVASEPDTTDIWPNVIKINISAFGGFSGSPVFDADENVVGILVAGLKDQSNLAIMVPVRRLCVFLDK